MWKPKTRQDIQFFDPMKAMVDPPEPYGKLSECASDMRKYFADKPFFTSDRPVVFAGPKYRAVLSDDTIADIVKAFHRVGQAAADVAVTLPSHRLPRERLRYRLIDNYAHGTVFRVTRGRRVKIGQVCRTNDGHYHIYPHGAPWTQEIFTSMRAAMRALGQTESKSG